jgi:aspartyl-tRNA(Asn)/glutamyl-tRNA(Gln) amidotransferase subunit C
VLNLGSMAQAQTKPTVSVKINVKHVAKLANLILAPGEEEKFAGQFADTLTTVGLINELDTSQIGITTQVTGLENITREDAVDSSRMLTQEQALSNASKTYNGYFVVPAIFQNE